MRSGTERERRLGPLRHEAENSDPAKVQIEAVPFEQLGSGELEAWSALQRRNPTFESPFFRPEFVQVLATVQPNIEVAVFRTAGRCAGFWPFQRGPGNVAYVPGADLCTYEGVVAEPAPSWSAADLLEACGISAWRFNNAVASQAALQPFHWIHFNSAVIDLASGFEEYVRRKRCERCETIKKMLTKRRRLGRDVGPIRLVSASDDERLVDLVIDWKRAQFKRIRSIDHFAPAWRREFVRRIAAFRNDDFCGQLSALYAGDHLLAAHLGIRSHGVLHGWLPVYNRRFQEYSPGTVFWITLAEHAAEMGIRRIDLGTGQDRYKDSLKTDDVPMAEGAVDPRFFSRAIRKGLWSTRRALLASPAGKPLRDLVRAYRSMRIDYGAGAAADSVAKTTQFDS